MSLVNSGISWLRQTVAWSNSWPSWRERLVLALFFALAIGLGVACVWLQLWQAILLWTVYFLALTISSWQGWLLLFGPVLFYDMIRTARRARYVAMRLLYAGLLLFVLCFLYISIAADRRVDMGEFFLHLGGFFAFVLVQIALITWLRFVESRRGRYYLLGIIAALFILLAPYVAYLAVSEDRNLTPRDTAILAESFFTAFLIVQLAAVVLLTPAYVAGSIADEKERRTLEFMLATDLSNHEIVLSKLLSRLANITLFLLTGLPILSILQFLGGVDNELMLAGFAATGLTMLGIAGVSILFSTLFKRPRDSIGLTYMGIVAYGALATVGKVLAESGAFFMSDAIWFGGRGPTFAEVSEWINIGNPIAATIDVSKAIATATLAAELPVILTRYAWFHLVLFAVCIVWSILRLRAIGLKQTVGGKTAKLSWWERYRPAVGELPMIWKELHIEGRTRLNLFVFVFAVVLVVLTVGSGLLIILYYAWQSFFPIVEQGGDPIQVAMNWWFRIAGTIVAGLMALMAAVRASTCITSERERDTFEALITTPLSADAILGAKLLGSLVSLRMGSLWYGSMIAIALFSGGIHLLAVPLVIAAWFVYVLFFTMVGMWFSMACKSSMRASVLTVVTTLFMGGGHWLLLGLCFYFPAAMLVTGGSGNLFEYFLKFHFGLTPPFVLGYCAYSWQNLAHDYQQRDLAELFVFCLIGLFIWAMGCVIMWYGILLPKFRELTRREEMIYQ